jgi:predicted PurR-regulated permease PerM
LGRLLIISALLAYVLHPVASWVESLGLNRAAATALIFCVVGLLMVSLATILYPIFTDQLEALQTRGYADQADALIRRTQDFLQSKFAFLGLSKVNLSEEVEHARDELGRALSKFLIGGLVPSVAQLIAIPFISFFLVKDARKMKQWVIGLVPNRYFEFSLDVLYKMDLAMGNFLRGQCLDGIIFGLLTSFAMWLLNVKYFMFIGVFAGMANLIPYLGPFAGAALAVVDVLLTSSDPSRVLAVLVAFSAVKLLDDAFIQPLIVARSVRMHPLIVLLAILIGGHFFGVLGMLLAVPVAGFMKVAFDAGLLLFRKYRFSTHAGAVSTA